MGNILEVSHTMGLGVIITDNVKPSEQYGRAENKARGELSGARSTISCVWEVVRNYRRTTTLISSKPGLCIYKKKQTA